MKRFFPYKGNIRIRYWDYGVTSFGVLKQIVVSQHIDEARIASLTKHGMQRRSWQHRNIGTFWSAFNTR